MRWGLEGTDGRLCWHEWGCVGAVDLDDPAVWAQANPAFGIRLHENTIRDERASMDDDTFARERCGVFGIATGQRVISAEAWDACADSSLRNEGAEASIAVAVSPARDSTTIVAATWTAGEPRLPFVDVAESRNGEPDWVIHRITEMWGKHDIRACVIDGMSAANTLIDPLRRAGVTVTVTTATQMTKACGGFYDAAVFRQMRHLNQTELNVAVSVARKRQIGDGGFGWSRKDSESDISPLVAATLALWGLTSSEVEPKPRKRSGRACFV